MRCIGHLSDPIQATRFSGFLVGQGIDNEVEREGEVWVVWIRSEDDLEAARRHLRKFSGNPYHPYFAYAMSHPRKAPGVEEATAGGSLGETKMEGEAGESGKAGSTWEETLATVGIGPLTFALILGCMVLGLVSRFGGNVDMLQPLFVTQFGLQGEYATWMHGLPEIRAGEVWRLFSPVLVHFGFLHLLFNLLWFVVMASMIEARERTGKLLFLLLVIGGISNLAQHVLSGPYFGGLSGVLYGFLGYIWMKVRFDPGAGYFLGVNTVTLLMIWFFLCLLGVIPNVANMAHVFGLLSGFGLGFVSVWRARRRGC